MDKEPDGNGRVFIEGVDYALPDKEDSPYEQARRFVKQASGSQVDQAIERHKRFEEFKQRVRKGLAAAKAEK